MAGEPPPYGVPRKKNTTTVVLVILGLCAACCIIGVIVFAGAGFFAFKKMRNTIGCALGFTEAGLAMKDYAKAHDNKLPPADTWQDAIRPYYAKRIEADLKKDGSNVFGSFDPEGQWVCKDESGSGQTGIAFNTDLAGKSLDDIQNKSTTIVLFEVPKTGSNLNMPYTELSDSTSPRTFNTPRGWFTVNANLQEAKGPKTSHTNITIN
jgi:hypothetical protein